jgi:hypothetical protein
VKVEAEPLGDVLAPEFRGLGLESIEELIELVEDGAVLLVEIHAALGLLLGLSIGERKLPANCLKPSFDVLPGALANVIAPNFEVGLLVAPVAFDQVGSKHVEKRAIGVRVSVMGCRCQEKKVLAPIRDLSNGVVATHVRLLAGSAVRHRGVVSLVHDDEVPFPLKNLVTDLTVLRVVDRDDETVKVEPRIRSWWYRTLKRLTGFATHDSEVLVEEIPHLLLPLLAQVGGSDDENGPCLIPREEFTHDQPSFDGLAEAGRVRKEKSARLEPQRHDERNKLILNGHDRRALQG